MSLQMLGVHNSMLSSAIGKTTKAGPLIDDLLSKSKDSLIKNDLESCEKYLNLIALFSSLDINQLIKFLSFKFRLYFSKDENIPLMVIKNYLSFISNSLYEMEISQENKKIIHKQIYIFADVMHSNENYFYEYFYYYTLQQLRSTSIEDKFSIEIRKKAIDAYEEMNKRVIKEKEKFKKNKFIKNFKTLKELFINQKYSYPKQKTKSCFIVSFSWIKIFLYFLKTIPIEGYNESIERIYQCRRTSYLYFRNEISTEDFNKYSPAYPGPINNYFIIDNCDSWVDPDKNEQYTNIYLSNDAIDDVDYKYIDQQTYIILKNTFGINYEIERMLVNDDYYEVFLLKFKILVLSPLLMRINFANLIRVRNFQISRNKSVKDLKEKIIRCINYEIYKKFSSKLKENTNFFPNALFHIVNPDFSSEAQNEIYNIINCYYNKYSVYKQKLKGVEISSDDQILETLKLSETDLLIVEVINKDKDDGNKQFQWYIQLKTLEDYKKCNLCNNPITGSQHKCSNCSQYIYCSEKCRKNDIKHRNHHTNLDLLYKKKFALHDMLCVDISSIVSPLSKHGLTGLKNIGNTCYMNSSLQCLSNCEEFTKYFLLKKYKEELNENNKYGSGGAIARAYYELIDQLWNSNQQYWNPWEFKQSFGKFFPQFANSSQHDSHELLVFMLDALHEDLNRVKSKPYCELKERRENETEEEASLRWWKSHIDRENSIIVDLFHGQFKSVVRCPQCNRVNTIYDPFMHLGLPIPAPQSKIRVKLIIDINLLGVEKENNFNFNDVNLYVFYYSCNDATNVREIKSKLTSEIEKMNKNNLISKMKNIFIEGIICDCHKNFKKYLNNDDEEIINYYLNGYEAVFYAIERTQGVNYFNFYISPVIITKSSKSSKASKITHLFYPKIFSVELNLSIRELYYYFFIYYRKLFKDISNHSYEDFMKNKDNINYLNEEFTDYLEVKDSTPFKLHIVNNVPHKAAFSCEYCNRSCEYCLFNFKFSQNVKNVQKSQKISRPFILFLEVILHSNNQFIPNDLPDENFKTDLITKSKDITIYDCLEAFRAEEKLAKENSWYCSTCKSHQEAVKKIEIYRAPNIVIIQLKRFKVKGNYSMTNKKIDSFVDFPINELDLRQFIVEENSRKEAIYNLFAISRHYGDLSSGHYTAMCQNKGEWYDFDDERVIQSSTSNIVSKYAYLLFYRKKNLGKV